MEVFNKDRYFAIAGSGLIGLTVSIPVLIFSKPKYFMMKNQILNKVKISGTFNHKQSFGEFVPFKKFVILEAPNQS